MIIEPCCPGRTVTKKIIIGGREVGISGLDSIFEKAFEMDDAPDELLKEILFAELKEHNYIPKPAEKDYSDGIWKAFSEEKERRQGKDSSRKSCCSCKGSC